MAFAKGKTREHLDQDEMLVLSLVKCIEIIGEASSKASDQCQKENPNVPWADIIGMRHRLIHAYFDINLNIVWSTITQELPALIIELEHIILSK